jgi:chaperone required for assembly of F1-ATPase
MSDEEAGGSKKLPGRGDLGKDISVDPSERAPIRAAARDASRQLAKRFYREVSLAPADAGFAILLDGKPVRTPARRPLAAPTRALAEALAAEWTAQKEWIDPGSMLLTRLFNSAIDGVADHFAEVEAETVKYAGSDLVCYRAAEPEALAAAQAERWDPLVKFAHSALDAPLVVTEGVVFAPQPPQALVAISSAVRAIVGAGGPESNLKLAALHIMTTVTGSCVIALALALGRIGVDDAFAAANVDEDYQMARWGEDAEALARRQARLQDLRVAAQVSQAFGS